MGRYLSSRTSLWFTNLSTRTLLLLVRLPGLNLLKQFPSAESSVAREYDQGCPPWLLRLVALSNEERSSDVFRNRKEMS